MSYDISLCDPVTHKPLKADSTHFIAGGMRAMGGTKELWLNVTYNYGHFYYRPEVFGENGIRSIYGKTDRAKQMLCNKLEKFERHDWKAILDQSIYAGWQDIYALKQDDQYEQSTEMEFPRL